MRRPRRRAQRPTLPGLAGPAPSVGSASPQAAGPMGACLSTSLSVDRAPPGSSAPPSRCPGIAIQRPRRRAPADRCPIPGRARRTRTAAPKEGSAPAGHCSRAGRRSGERRPAKPPHAGAGTLVFFRLAPGHRALPPPIGRVPPFRAGCPAGTDESSRVAGGGRSPPPCGAPRKSGAGGDPPPLALRNRAGERRRGAPPAPGRGMSRPASASPRAPRRAPARGCALSPRCRRPPPRARRRSVRGEP